MALRMVETNCIYGWTECGSKMKFFEYPLSISYVKENMLFAVPCKTVGSQGKPCIFPFQYAGTTYDKCTPRDSDSGQPWCATEIDEEGYVVDNAWGDCLEGCPGTSTCLVRSSNTNCAVSRAGV